MNDDWRLQIDFVADGLDDALLDRLDARELENDLSEAFLDRVIVTRNGTTVFLYAGDREQAEKAQRLIEEFARREEEDVDIAFTRWHSVAQNWKPANVPLPADDAARAAEHQERIAAERKEVEEQGYPDYEVAVGLSSNEEAEKLADRYRAEGLPTVQRWDIVLVGVTDVDHAHATAERVRAETPPGTEVAVQGTLRDIETTLGEYDDLDDLSAANPFSFFGIGR
jgi:hypothetical protein